MLRHIHLTAGWVVLTVLMQLLLIIYVRIWKKQSEEEDSDLEFGLQQEVLLKGLMHFVQDLTHVGRSIEDLDLDEISLEAIDNAIERAKNKEAFIKQSKSVSAAGDPGKVDKNKQ